MSAEKEASFRFEPRPFGLNAGKGLSDAVTYNACGTSLGADTNSIAVDEVSDASDSTLIQLFIDRGADLVTGYPFAKGLIRATRLFLKAVGRIGVKLSGALGSDLNIHHSMFKVVVRMLAGRFNDFSGSDCAAGVLERLAHNRASGQSAAISVNTEC